MEIPTCKELQTKPQEYLTQSVFGDFSDLTIVCGKDAYPVHKVLVCALSPVLMRAMKFPGKEAEETRLICTTLNQPSSNCSSSICREDIEICNHHHCGNSCDYDCFNFTGKVCFPVEGEAEDLLTHTKIYGTADEYDIVGLKKLSIEKFRRACLHFWDSPEFVGIIDYVFAMTPEHDKGLRDIVCNTISQHMSLLDKLWIRALMTECNELVFGVLLLEKARRRF
ncbi:hypothetical protein T440DRAFT_482817 [Plenodomus tracheiphilus IPT5]|uniref:Uncharacterized protein n=1 Tax=Plenodomus tracheiphilus IPT5 TaxID=1408161 RepID=A0A6A7AS69_9PLEO|nr:hypothetical protein T440DRAFT_482817 [Plenodomus tracheiphilus IPT5]